MSDTQLEQVREPREDQVRENQGTEDFLRKQKVGFHAAGMGFDGGLKGCKWTAKRSVDGGAQGRRKGGQQGGSTELLC